MKRIIPFIIIVILLIVIKNIVGSLVQILDNDRVVTDLEQEFVAKKQENVYLSERLKYVKSIEFVEEEARNKLGLVKEGEFLVVASAPATTQTENNPIEKEANWKKWMRLVM